MLKFQGLATGFADCRGRVRDGGWPGRTRSATRRPPVGFPIASWRMCARRLSIGAYAFYMLRFKGAPLGADKREPRPCFQKRGRLSDDRIQRPHSRCRSCRRRVVLAGLLCGANSEESPEFIEMGTARQSQPFLAPRDRASPRFARGFFLWGGHAVSLGTEGGRVGIGLRTIEI
jgi:hypothetical protein